MGPAAARARGWRDAARRSARRRRGGHGGGAEWIASEESVGDPAWVGIGYSTADGGLLLILVATGLAWRASRRSAGGAGGSARAVMALSALLIVAYGVAIWAMTAKPS